MSRLPIFLLLFSFLACTSTGQNSEDKIKVLIVDGINNHDWKNTTIATKATLEHTGRFKVDVSTTPGRRASKEEWAAWKPDFFKYDVIIGNFNDDCEKDGGCEIDWSKETMANFEKFVSEGGGFVPIHAADNSFTRWPAYNEMIGGGGWGGRQAGVDGYLYRLIDDEWTRSSPDEGLSGEHGRQSEFLVIHDQPDHPIVKGLPAEWLHAKDELYSALRGPWKNAEVIGHSYSKLTKKYEPQFILITYGKGKVFHIAPGHYNDEFEPYGGPVYCVGYQTLLARGTEYVATGKVTIGIPESFPTKNKAVEILPSELVWP